MVPVPEGETLEALNEQILSECLSYGNHKISGRDKKVSELFQAEKSHLLTIPEVPFSNVQIYNRKADKYATVIVDKNRYSVPVSHVGLKMRVLLHVDRVDIIYGGKKIAIHERLYGNNKWSLHPEHYLELIKQRPLSFNSARPIRQWRKSWPEAYNRLLARFCEAQGETKGIKDFISVLMLHKDYQAPDVETAVELALQCNVSFSEGVRHLLLYTEDTGFQQLPLENWSSFPSPDLTEYAQLGGVR